MCPRAITLVACASAPCHRFAVAAAYALNHTSTAPDGRCAARAADSMCLTAAARLVRRRVERCNVARLRAKLVARQRLTGLRIVRGGVPLAVAAAARTAAAALGPSVNATVALSATHTADASAAAVAATVLAIAPAVPPAAVAAAMPVQRRVDRRLDLPHGGGHVYHRAAWLPGHPLRPLLPSLLHAGCDPLRAGCGL